MKKFLLLSGIATIAVASVALAEDPAPVTAATYTNRATAKLTASINIYSPITMTNGSIYFPSITETNMHGSAPIKVKVNPDGTIAYGESTAQIIENEAIVSPITITGGNIGSYKSAYAAEEADAEALDEGYSNEFSFGGSGEHTVELANTIPMYVMNGSTLSDTKCGEVSALTPEWHYTNYTNNGKGALKLSIGGTFTLENFELNDGFANCEGSTTVTYIMDL